MEQELWGCFSLCCFNFVLVLFACVFFETVSHGVTLAILELTIWTRLASNSQRSTYLYLLSAMIRGVRHHTWLLVFLCAKR